VYLRHFYDIKS